MKEKHRGKIEPVKKVSKKKRISNYERTIKERKKERKKDRK